MCASFLMSQSKGEKYAYRINAHASWHADPTSCRRPLRAAARRTGTSRSRSGAVPSTLMVIPSGSWTLSTSTTRPSEHGDLDMTEKRIRTLEKTGFIDPVVTAGSSYKPTVAGVHRKPIQFSSEYVPLFIPSKRWAVAVRDRHSEAAWSFSGVGYQPSGVSGLRRSSNA
jgi:hypothetical protein